MVRPSMAPAPSGRPGRHQSDHLAEHLPALREALELQRTFRREQLGQLGARDRTDAHSPQAHGEDAASAHREVHSLLITGARRALADIDVALARMATGAYGRCRACAADIPLQLLTAIPSTTLCLDCRQGT